MTSKQRSFLMKLAASRDPVVQIGKGGVTPEVTQAVDEALEARELIKISVLKNNFEDIRETAQTVADRTRSQLVTVIGRKIVLYRMSKTRSANSRIVLPR